MRLTEWFSSTKIRWMRLASFHLTKKSVYTLFSTLFVVIILITVAILLLTPLRFYIPGYGSSKDRTEVIALRQRVDSLAGLVQAGDQQVAAIQKIIRGDDNGLRDTAMLKAELIQQSAQQSILPSSDEIKQQAALQTAQDKRKGGRKR